MKQQAVRENALTALSRFVGPQERHGTQEAQKAQERGCFSCAFCASCVPSPCSVPLFRRGL